MNRAKTKSSKLQGRPDKRLKWLLIAAIFGALAALLFYTTRSKVPNPASSTVQTTAAHPASAFTPTVPNQTPPPALAPEGMAWIPGGEFSMGSDDPRGSICGGPDSMGDARPIHRVYVDGFWMDSTEVTNEEFQKFVKATGYVTIAERKPTKEEFPDAPPENLVAGSTVFTPTAQAVPLNDHFQWWRYQKGANWRHPEGPESDLKASGKYPVVQIAYADAAAYAQWAGKRLPTEAEFEFAARGGLDRQTYAWGDELQPGGQWMANIWQGRFPYENTAEDGYRATAPVGSFPANGYGLYDMAGNVWQWCSDWYRHDYYATLAAAGSQPVRNPAGPSDSRDPAEPGV